MNKNQENQFGETHDPCFFPLTRLKKKKTLYAKSGRDRKRGDDCVLIYIYIYTHAYALETQ